MSDKTAEAATLAVITRGIDMDKEREAFEAWYYEDAMPLEANWFDRDPESPEYYAHSSTQHAWDGWQARAKLNQWRPADAMRISDKYVVAVDREGHCMALLLNEPGEVRYYRERCTHWMPLPEPPK